MSDHAELLDRYVSGEPVAVLARDFGLSTGCIRSRIFKSGLAGKRLEKQREAAAEVAEAFVEIARDLWSVDVLERTRVAHVCEARQAVMLALHRDGHSLQNIAAALGLQDHTTVIHGVRKAKASPDLSAMASVLTRRLSEH